MKKGLAWALLLCGGVLLHVRNASSNGICSPSPCGANTDCIVRASRAVCVCRSGYHGNPIAGCSRGECMTDSECGPNRRCGGDGNCVDPCSTIQCGYGAICTPRNHVAVCTCPHGQTGDALRGSCRPYRDGEGCGDYCGRNTQCVLRAGVPTCICLPGYFGDGHNGCRPECEEDTDCGGSQSCRNNKCISTCTANTCGVNSRCDSVRHKPVCTCNPGYFGDAYSGCTAECESHYDCPQGRPACSAGKCIDPCAGSVCGINANCRVKDRTTPVCSCPKHMTGDPFIRCRPFEKSDLCIPNPCGANAECTPGHDRTGQERPVCTCQRGYVGDALRGCTRGECSTDYECTQDKTCVNNACQSVCAYGACGHQAECTAQRHTAVCSCPPGTTGEPLRSCKPIPRPVSATYRDGRYYYLKK